MMPSRKPTPPDEPGFTSLEDAKSALAERAHAEIVRAHSVALAAQTRNIEATFAQLAEFCHSWFSGVQGFSRDNFDGDTMLVVTELAEAVEADRKKAPSDKIPEFLGTEEEFADALVRLFHAGAKYNLRLGPAFIAKMHYNLTRPYRHGKGY